MIRKLWNDDCGTGGSGVIEWAFFVTIVVIGSITGLVAVRQAIISELTETAQALLALNQSFSFSGQSNCEASTAGSSASDTVDTIHEASVVPSSANISQLPCD